VVPVIFCVIAVIGFVGNLAVVVVPTAGFNWLISRRLPSVVNGRRRGSDRWIQLAHFTSTSERRQWPSSWF